MREPYFYERDALFSDASYHHSGKPGNIQPLKLPQSSKKSPLRIHICALHFVAACYKQNTPLLVPPSFQTKSNMNAYTHIYRQSCYMALAGLEHDPSSSAFQVLRLSTDIKFFFLILFKTYKKPSFPYFIKPC